MAGCSQSWKGRLSKDPRANPHMSSCQQMPLTKLALLACTCPQATCWVNFMAFNLPYIHTYALQVLPVKQFSGHSVPSLIPHLSGPLGLSSDSAPLRHCGSWPWLCPSWHWVPVSFFLLLSHWAPGSIFYPLGLHCSLCPALVSLSLMCYPGILGPPTSSINPKWSTGLLIT